MFQKTTEKNRRQLMEEFVSQLFPNARSCEHVDSLEDDMKIEDQEAVVDEAIPELISFLETMGDQLWQTVNGLVTYPRSLLSEVRTISPFNSIIASRSQSLTDNIPKLMNNYMELL